MIKIAITGNIASGKSFVEDYLSSKGHIVYDADQIVHSLLEENLVVERLVQVFSDKILTNNLIDRKLLGEIVFNNSEKLKKLEQIIHPEVKSTIKSIFEKHNNEKAVFISIPLLFEAGFETLFDKIIMMKIDQTIQLNRLISRNNYTKEDALIRINAQLAQDTKVNKSNFVIDNSFSKQNTIDQLEQILNQLDMK